MRNKIFYKVDSFFIICFLITIGWIGFLVFNYLNIRHINDTFINYIPESAFIYGYFDNDIFNVKNGIVEGFFDFISDSLNNENFHIRDIEQKVKSEFAYAVFKQKDGSDGVLIFFNIKKGRSLESIFNNFSSKILDNNILVFSPNVDVNNLYSSDQLLSLKNKIDFSKFLRVSRNNKAYLFLEGNEAGRLIFRDVNYNKSNIGSYFITLESLGDKYKADIFNINSTKENSQKDINTLVLKNIYPNTVFLASDIKADILKIFFDDELPAPLLNTFFENEVMINFLQEKQETDLAKYEYLFSVKNNENSYDLKNTLEKFYKIKFAKNYPEIITKKLNDGTEVQEIFADQSMVEFQDLNIEGFQGKIFQDSEKNIEAVIGAYNDSVIFSNKKQVLEDVIKKDTDNNLINFQNDCLNNKNSKVYPYIYLKPKKLNSTVYTAENNGLILNTLMTLNEIFIINQGGLITACFN